MTRPPRGTHQNKWSDIQWAGALVMLITVGLSLLLLGVPNSPPASLGGAQGQDPVISAPDPGQMSQPVLSEYQKTPVVTSSDSPATSASDTTETPVLASEAIPEPDKEVTEETSEITSPAAPATDSSNPERALDQQPPITRLLIPAIGVDAAVEVKSIDADGVMQSPDSAWSIAWYDFSARPEDEGNAVFSGHLDYWGVGPAVFWQLGDLKSGDEITVTMQDGSVVAYQVTSVESFPATADASPVVASTGVPMITMITCDGRFDPATQEYDQRIVVTGHRIGQ
jgi:LPXTG-site transpeptidase (sortase) family protein